MKCEKEFKYEKEFREFLKESGLANKFLANCKYGIELGLRRGPKYYIAGAFDGKDTEEGGHVWDTLDFLWQHQLERLEAIDGKNT